jgi:hypothetical protein
MDAQELRSLQEAYLEVYQELDEGYLPWDFGPRDKAKAKYAELSARKAAGGSAPGTATRANRIASVGREMRTTLDKDSAATMTDPKKQGLQPSTPRHTAAALRGAGGGSTARKKFDVKPLKPTKSSRGGSSSAQSIGSPSGTTGRFQVGGGRGYGISGIKLADSYEYDLYDIILSHLLDEGYAETPEAAEKIMVNMSEEWRESIVEAFHPVYGRGGEQRRTQTALQGLGKHARATDKKKLHNIPKGGTTISDRDPQGERLGTGEYDRGKGNKAKRRAAAKGNG